MAGPLDPYRIRPAQSAEVPRLSEIENEAGRMFAGLGLIDESLDVSFPLDALRQLVDRGQVWVAIDAADRAVGIVIASVRDHTVHVEEMDVLPEHGRRGLGTRLLARVGEWARERGYLAVTLSTFRDVPWNGPFYRRQGFRVLAPHEWSPAMYAIREAEARHGLRVDARVFMRLDLPRTGEHRLQVRVARQTGRLAEVVAFYRDGLGLPEVDRFRGHAGYDGVMLDLPGTGAHLEFTATEHVQPPAAHPEDLLVLYLGDRATVDRVLARLAVARVRSLNPYWDEVGVAVVDPDGFRVVLVAQDWR